MTPDIAGSINRTPTGSHRRCAKFNIITLGGGATRTLRLDQTGKSMGQALLWMEVEVE